MTWRAPRSSAVALLEPSRRAETRLAGGYLDLLGPAGAKPSGRAQRLMLTGALPRVYDRWWRPALGRVAKGPLGSGMAGERRMARSLLALGRGDVALDVGCGTGVFTCDFAVAVGAEGLVVGLDASPAMLARAVRETREGNVAFVRADAERLPFRSGVFDAVCCFAALHLFADPWAALDEMSRVTARGGRIAILASRGTGSSPLRLVEAGLAAGLGVHMFGAGQLTAALAERGFLDVRRHVQGLTQYVAGRRA